MASVLLQVVGMTMPICHAEDFARETAPIAPELRRTAQRLTRSSIEAEDLVQETLERAYGAWGRFADGSNVRAWLHRILRNAFLDGVRRRRAERRALDSAAAQPRDLPSTPEHEVLHGVRPLSRAVEQALADLPEEFRDVVLLVGLRDYSYQEAADALGCPVGTVMSRLHRGRRALREKLRDAAFEHGIGHAA
ncbi:MAG: sigma-70 family RNA polymerase sigma factor [Polyangiales bacterium]